MVKCPECNNEDKLEIRCMEKESDGTLTYKCHKCKCKFKINDLELQAKKEVLDEKFTREEIDKIRKIYPNFAFIDEEKNKELINEINMVFEIRKRHLLSEK